MALDEDLKRKIDEIHTAAEAELNERIARMADDPAALKKHLLHLSEVFNNQVTLIHMYREYIHDINAEISRQCHREHHRTQLDAKPLTKLLDTHNRRIMEARQLCRTHEPKSLLKTCIWKLADVKPCVPEQPADESPTQAIPNVSDGPQAVREYLISRFGWLDHGPETVYFVYLDNDAFGFMRFVAEVRLGNKIEIAYGPKGEIRWTAVPPSFTMFNPVDWQVVDSTEIEREMFKTLFGAAEMPSPEADPE